MPTALGPALAARPAVTPLLTPCRLVADRVLCDRTDRAVDLVSGREVLLRVASIGPAVEQRAWAERSARWYAWRHPRQPRLHDFGVMNEYLRFEVIEVAVDRRLPTFLMPDARRLTRRSTRGHSIQPRAAVTRAAAWIDAAQQERVSELHVCGPFGSGLSTSGALIAREARLRGFVPVSVSLLAALSPEVRDEVCVMLGARHLFVLRDGRQRPRAETDVLARLARTAERPIAMVTLDRAAPRSAQLVPLDPLDEDALARMIGAETAKGTEKRRFRTCVERSEGWPARFIDAWRRTSAIRYTVKRSRVLIAAERAPEYGLAEPGAAARASDDALSDAAARDAVDRAASLARAGRHAAARGVLKACVAQLERRSAALPVAVVRLALGRLARQRGQTAEAVASLDAARDAAHLDTAGDIGAAIAVELCRALIDQGELRRAESLARMAQAAARPSMPSPALASALAEALYWQGRYDDADDLLVQIHDDTSAEAVAVRARVALAREEIADAGSLAQRALDLSRASGEEDAPRLAAVAAAILVSGSVADVTRVHEYASAGLDAARGLHRPVWALEIRLARVEALLRANATAAAKLAARGLSRFTSDQGARLLRARVKTLLAAASKTTIRPHEFEGIQALADLHASLTPGAARGTKRRVRDDLRDLLDLAQEAPDELDALQRMAAFIAAALRHAIVGVFGGDESSTRAIACSGSRGGPVPEVVRRAIAAGLLIGPSRGPAGVDVACPIRFAGARIGALFCRWTIEGPLDWTRIEVLLTAAASAAGPCLRAVLDRGRDQARSASTLELIGGGDAMRRLREDILKAGPAPFAVLIEGESGSGKELVARAIHRASPRRDRPWCAVNCAALTDDLLDAELFGHARGAFTGALADRPGLFEEADGGTLVLDEIGELSPRAQAKLLRTIQEGEVRRLGENTTRRVDVRLVAATNRRLWDEVSAGRFRQDLWYRLAVVRIPVPPLRARPDDVPELAAEFWRRATERLGSRAVLTSAAVAALARYDWPGNVRELQNVMAALSVAAPRRGSVGPSMLPDAIVRAAAERASTLGAARRTFERRFVRAALARAGGRLGVAARDLGITRQGLSKLLARLDLDAAPGLQPDQATAPASIADSS